MAAKERKNGRHNRNKPAHISSVGVSTDPLRPERTTQHGNGRRGSKIGKPSVLNMWNVSFVLFAVAFGVLQYYHVSTMFEYDRFFSHLSDLEREMTFRSEMGFYFSYYKEMTAARSIGDGFSSATLDKTVEYPKTVNALKRFNIYPEMFLGILKRGYESFMQSINQPTRMCYNVRRGRGLSDVQSCEGMGDIAIFYINSIFFWNGCMMSAFFILAVVFSGSLFGGFIAVAAFFYNHGECTRVQWTPPLRESMGYPFFILQLLAITYTLSIPRPRWLHSAFIFIPSLFFMLCWQFAQFTLLTQMLSIFATFMLGYIRLSTLRCVLQGQSVALVTAYILLFGNELLLTSYYPACLITLWVIVCLEPVFQDLSSRKVLWILQSVILVAGTASFKFLISSLLHVADDAHIGNLLMSKISDYKDFHTLLYICSKEFDFIETETIFRFLYSLLLPSALAALLMVMYNLLKGEYNRWSRQGDAGIKNKIDLQTNPKEGAEFVYHIFQTCAFVIMAGLIMRLKLFLTPQLCLLSSLLASRKVFHFIKEPVTHRALVVALIAVMTVKGVDNIREQRSHVGDFENGRLEDALEWIKSNTPKDAVFAGAMPTTSAVKLSTGRPIVNHPHYEDTEMRERTLKVYTIYSRKPTREVYSTLREMRVQYVILEYSWCVRRYRPGCSLPEIWDVEDDANRGKEPTCMRLKRNAGPFFKEVFKNLEYTILKLNKVSQKINSQRIEVSATE